MESELDSVKFAGQYCPQNNRMRLRMMLLALLVFQGVGYAQNIGGAMLRLLQDPSLKHAGVSITVMDVQSGQVIAAHQKDLCLIPASSLKVATTAAAISILGKDYTYKTQIQYDGSVQKELLNGNLFIKGSGDPTLGSDRFRETPSLTALMARFQNAIKQKGIRKISGFIIGDESYFESEARPPSWQLNDIGNSYGVGAWGLNIFENYYYLYFKQNPKKEIRPRIMGHYPKIPNLLLINEVRASEDSIDNAYIFASPYANMYYVRGYLPVGKGFFTIKGAIPDPPYLAAYLLRQMLEKNGIKAAKKATTYFEFTRARHRSSARTTIYVHESPPLSTIVKRTNLESNNLYCEALLKTLGKRVNYRADTYEGVDVVTKFWKNKGLDLEGFKMEDGSGLSPRNAVSSFHLASIMRAAAQDSVIFETFYESLPEAGSTGTMSNMLRNTIAWGRVKAKTGTMKAIKSYTGYARTKSNRLVTFSILINNHASNAKLKEMVGNIMIELCKLK